MKNICFLCLLIFCLNTGNVLRAQEKQQSFREGRMKWLEQFDRVWDNNPEIVSLYKLFKKKAYQAVIERTGWRVKRYPEQADYLAFYSAALYELGFEDSARRLVKHYMDVKAKGYFGLVDLFLYQEYPCFYNIAGDTILHQYAYKVYTEDYKMKHYPNTALGLKLIRLFYRDQLMRYELDFALAQCDNKTEEKAAYNRFKKKAAQNTQELLKIYQDHPAYISGKAVGPVSACQNLLIWHQGGEDSIATQIFFPLLKKAMQAGEITPDEYVHQLTQKYFRAGDIKRYRAATDSLCKIYGCKNHIIWTDERKTKATMSMFLGIPN